MMPNIQNMVDRAVKQIKVNKPALINFNFKLHA